MSKHVVVLGAGISGLSVAWRLSNHGARVSILESNPFVGGLAATVRHNGFCMDMGPHSFFSSDKRISDAVLGLFNYNLRPFSRKVKFYYNGKYLDYPLTIHSVLFQMGFSSGFRAFASFIKNRALCCRRDCISKEGENVEDWAVANFGDYLYRTFFKPYTEQFWGFSCSELSSDCIPTHTKVSFVNTLKLLLHIKNNGRNESLAEREKLPVYYPDTGFAEISERIAGIVRKNQGDIRLSCEVTGVSCMPGGRFRVFYKHNGKQKEMEAGHVISTIPITLLANMLIPAVPDTVKAAACKLVYRPLLALGMLTKKQNILNCGYIYLLNRPFNRIFEMNEFSPRANASGKNILAVELPCTQQSAIWSASKEDLFEACIQSLSSDGFIARDDIAGLILAKSPHAYPVYKKGYSYYLNLILNYFKQYKSLDILGRSGEFMYMDTDECIKRSFDLADRCMSALV